MKIFKIIIPALIIGMLILSMIFDIKSQKKVIEEKEKQLQELQEEIESLRSLNELYDTQLVILKNEINEYKIDNKEKQVQEVSRGEKNYETKVFEVTAYTAGKESTGKTPSDPGYGITALGTRATEGRTVACPPSMDFGTKLYIENVGYRICEDRGGAITENHLDVYMENLQDALNFGRQNLLVRILGKE